MKEIKSKTSSAGKKLVPWFEAMVKQVGLSKSEIAYVLNEQEVRISKLNDASAYMVSVALKRDCTGNYGLWNVYGKLALILERCKYIPCGSRACVYCTVAQQLHFQGIDIGGKHTINKLPTLYLDFLNSSNESSSFHWDAKKLVERHGDGMLK